MGDVSFLESYEETMNRIMHNAPVQYRVEFPNGKPVPSVKQITYNGDVICSGPGGNESLCWLK